MIFLSWPTFPGCVLEARPVGKLNMVDDKGVDEKILAVAQNDPRYQRIDQLETIEPHLLKEIEQFFGVYKSLGANGALPLAGQEKQKHYNESKLAGAHDHCRWKKQNIFSFFVIFKKTKRMG